MKVISVGNPTPSGIWHFVRINGQELNVLSEKPLVPGNLYQIKKTFFNKLAIVSEQGPAEKAATGETTVVPDPGYSIFAESGFHQIFQIILEQEKDAQFNRVSGGYSFSLPVLGIGNWRDFFGKARWTIRCCFLCREWSIQRITGIEYRPWQPCFPEFILFAL